MIQDEELTSFLDGETDAERTQAIEAALKVDGDLRTRLERLRLSNNDVKAAFGALLAMPASERLAASIRAAAARSAPAEPAEVIPFKARPPAARRWAWPASVAAALVGGVLVGQLAGQAISPDASDWLSGGKGAPRAGTALAAGLSGASSGVAFALPGERKATPVLTFASQSGQLCRQFEIAGSGTRQSGLACRSAADAWRLVALTSVAHATGGGDFQTAAGPGSDPVSAVADRLIKGEPMDAAQEAAALRAGASRSGTPAR